MSGYFLPLSGGADSSATAAIVGSMCQLVLLEITKGNEQVLSDVRRITKMSDYTPPSAQDLASRIFFTCYMGTTNSSKETRKRAESVAAQAINLFRSLKTLIAFVVQPHSHSFSRLVPIT